MIAPTTPPPGTAELVERLAAHRMLGSAPRHELAWLAEHGHFTRFDPGAVVSRKGDPVDYMVIQFTGRTSSTLDRGSGMRYVLETHGGEVSALLPFSRLRSSLGDVVVEEPTELIVIYRDAFPEMIRECPVIIETLVHYMLDRSRVLAATTMQDDKMMAMGRMAAGLAHELNNPASAAARSAKMLHEALIEARQSWRALCAAQLTADEHERIEELAARSLIPVTTGVFSAIERADREDEVATWLEDHDADHAAAEALAESGVTVDVLDELAGDFTGPKLEVVLRWVAADYAARSLSIDVERAADRIHDLVSAVKRFAYMDRAAALEPTNVAQGLIDTVAVLATKAKSKSVAIRMDLPSDLPRLDAQPGELNQIWANLIENAIDAVGTNGEISVNAAREDGAIVVRVLDNGPGIPDDLRGRIFEPFFTTKPIGQGTGLGLDIALSAVRAHNGQLTVDSRPGRTEFRVILPLGSPKAA
jgi:signal transduction histidine kinase